jgi:hypothetical protein
VSAQSRRVAELRLNMRSASEVMWDNLKMFRRSTPKNLVSKASSILLTKCFDVLARTGAAPEPR